MINFRKSVGITTGVTVPVLWSEQVPGSDRALKVEPFGAATHVVIDATGYYLPPLSIQVAADGEALVSNGRAWSLRTGVGAYTVEADRDVHACVPQVSAEPLLFGSVIVAGSWASGSTVVVRTRRADTGALIDSPFYLTVAC